MGLLVLKWWWWWWWWWCCLTIFFTAGQEVDILKSENELVILNDYNNMEEETFSKTERIFLYEKVNHLEKRIDHLYTDRGILERLLSVFSNPPGYIESFITNLNKRRYDTREVARKIKKWANS